MTCLVSLSRRDENSDTIEFISGLLRLSLPPRIWILSWKCGSSRLHLSRSVASGVRSKRRSRDVDDCCDVTPGFSN